MVYFLIVVDSDLVDFEVFFFLIFFFKVGIFVFFWLVVCWFFCLDDCLDIEIKFVFNIYILL